MATNGADFHNHFEKIAIDRRHAGFISDSRRDSVANALLFGNVWGIRSLAFGVLVGTLAETVTIGWLLHRALQLDNMSGSRSDFQPFYRGCILLQAIA